MLRLENVTKTYRRACESTTALKPTSLEISTGEFVAVAGPSGSGKTTLLSILGGMLAPDSGKVWIDGRSVYDLPASVRAAVRRQEIGFVFQTFNLVPYLTALENVKVPLMLRGLTGERQEQQATQLLSRMGLESRLHHKPSELSVGQQQRVALARTLANDPWIILADEPTGNLDPAMREEVLKFLEALCHDGRTVVLVTHDPAAASRAGRRLTIEDGAIADDSRGHVLRAA